MKAIDAESLIDFCVCFSFVCLFVCLFFGGIGENGRGHTHIWQILDGCMNLFQQSAQDDLGVGPPPVLGLLRSLKQEKLSVNPLSLTSNYRHCGISL